MGTEGTEFLLQLEADVDGPKAMDRELSKMDASLAKTDRLLKKTETDVTGFGSTLKKGGGWLGEFGSQAAATFTGMFAATAVFEGLKKGVHVLMDLGMEALHAAGDAERLRLSFENMVGVQMADDTLEYLDDLARHTEFTDGQLKTFAIQLTRAGYSGEELKRALAATADMASKSENALAGAGQAVELLSRMQLKGGLNARELVGAGIAPEKLYKRLATQLGVGVKTVEERLQQGKIDVKLAREALYAELVKPGGNLGDNAVRMADTFNAKMTKVKDIIPNLFEELEKSDGLKGLTLGLGKLVDALDPGAPAGKKIVAGLTHLLDWFGKLVASVDFDKFSDRVVSAMDFIEKTVDIAVVAFDVLYTLNPLRWLAIMNSYIIDGFSAFVDWFRDTFNVVADFATRFFDAGSEMAANLWLGIKDGLVGGVSSVLNAVSGFGGSIIDTLKNVLGIHSPSKVFALLGEQTTKGFTIGIRSGADDVQAQVEHTFSGGRFADAGAPARGGGSGSNIEINVSVGAGVDQANARDIGETIAVTIRAELGRLFDQLQTEGGAA